MYIESIHNGMTSFKLSFIYFHCYTVNVVELINYYTNYCTYIKFINITH